MLASFTVFARPWPAMLRASMRRCLDHQGGRRDSTCIFGPTPGDISGAWAPYVALWNGHGLEKTWFERLHGKSRGCEGLYAVGSASEPILIPPRTPMRAGPDPQWLDGRAPATPNIFYIDNIVTRPCRRTDPD